MASKTCTFIVIPDSTSDCKRYSVPKSLISFLAISAVIACVIAIGISYFLLSKYAATSIKSQQLHTLKKVAAGQKSSIDRYERDITRLSRQLSQIKQLNSRLIILTGLDPAKDTDVLGVGGADESDTNTETEE